MVTAAGPRAQVLTSLTGSRCEHTGCRWTRNGDHAAAHAREHSRISGHRVVVVKETRTVYDGSTP